MAPVAIELRPLDRHRDRAAVEAIDTAFETDTVFELVTTARGIELVERALDRPLTKRYAIDEVFAPWASWRHGWVAVAGEPGEAPAVQGFAAAGCEPWHERCVLWFLYVQPAWRRRGIGRALLDRVEAHAREAGATHVWLETSNVNVPGVRAYERLGYALCGVDTRYYGSYMPGEGAIYLAKPLG